jgi:hypothetical protein
VASQIAFRMLALATHPSDAGSLLDLHPAFEDNMSRPAPASPAAGVSSSREMVMMSRTASRVVAAVVLGALAAVALGGRLDAADEPAKDKEEEARRERQLKDMTRSAAQHALASADDPKRTFKLQEAALLRSSNPVSGSKDGAIFLWTDHGRPQAVFKLFTYDNKSYTHEWLSLSEDTLTARRGEKVIWEPAEPGVKFREVPDAPKPAETAAERLRQMKALSAKFTSEYTAQHLDAKPFALRLLAQPLLRYETEDAAKADGALFAFVQSTAPVGLLLLESRPTKDGRRWHYAYASLVGGPVTAKYGDKEVFSIEKNYFQKDTTRPYLRLEGVRVPKE